MADNGHAIYRTDEEVIIALHETGGNVTETAKMLGLKAVKALRQRINDDPSLKAELVEAREQLKDIAENNLAKAIRSRKMGTNLEPSKWFLTKQAKDRGYGDVVHTVNLNANLNAEYDFSQIPLEERKKLLDQLRSARRSDSPVTN